MKTIISLLFSLIIINCTPKANTNPDFILFFDELLKMHELGINDFDTRVSAKGYFVDEVSHETGYDMYTYSVKQDDPTKFFMLIKVINSKKESKLTSFMSAGNENYAELKMAVEKLGFKFYSTQELNNATTFVYVKDGIMVKLTPAKHARQLTTVKIISARIEPLEMNAK